MAVSVAPVKLSLRGLGHVPTFKNNKMLTRGKLITDPKKQEWMARCAAAFESRLLFLWQTTEAVMPMVRSLRSWIACVAPLDDSVNHIPEISVKVVKVAPGEEGADLLITPL